MVAPASKHDLLVNMIQTPDGTILRSRSRHDYRVYKDSVSGETYMVDGGIDYIRRNVCNAPHAELSLYSDSPHELLRERFEWGTYGKNGDQPVSYVALKDMSTNHIKAVLDGYESHLYVSIVNLFRAELKLRESDEC